MTLTAMRPDLGFGERAGGGAAQGLPGFLVDLGLQRRLQRLVGIGRGAEEIGVADEEAFLVVVGVGKRELMAVQAARVTILGCQFHGSSSLSRLIGCPLARRSITSLSQACGSRPLSLALSSTV